MRTFKLEIELENDDFIKSGETYMVAWILSKVVDHLRNYGLPMDELERQEKSLFDRNGNPCGKMGVEDVID